jgi:DNA invertase Pin-like site-specific DNA recombinase
MNFDTTSPTGKMMLTILGSIVEFEREIMLERQKDGIAKAHSEGKYRGRAPTARAKADQVFALDRAGKTREAIAKEVGISQRDCRRRGRRHPHQWPRPRVAEHHGKQPNDALDAGLVGKFHLRKSDKTAGLIGRDHLQDHFYVR